MTTVLATVSTANIHPVIDLVCNTVTSTHTKRAYSHALTNFMALNSATGQSGFNKATGLRP